MEGPCPDKFGFVQFCWTKKANDFTLEIVGFFVYRLASFGFDHNFDHNAKDFIWSNECRYFDIATLLI